MFVLRTLALSCALIAVPAAVFAQSLSDPILAQAPSPEPSPSALVTSSTPEPSRRPSMGAAPMDLIFPDVDFGGPLIGTNIDPTGYPLESAFAKNPGLGKFLDKNRIRLYGWLNPGIELTNTSSLSTFPISYNVLPTASNSTRPSCASNATRTPSSRIMRIRAFA